MRGIWIPVLAAAPVLWGAPPDFTTGVQPILRKRCVMCHNERLAQNGLRLDDPAKLREGGYSGPVLVPGKSAESKLFARISSTKKGFMMPPAGAPLTPGEIQIVKSWIDGGAQLPEAASAVSSAKPVQSDHWAFKPVRQPQPPAVSRPDWPKNPIDRFVLARLEREKIAPSPEAPKTTLIRRASLDIIGLPPTPEEVRAFLADQRPDAYERLVDRLLSSEHYGEQRARAWLDLARYADSDGYEKDQVRPYAWRWRNYVIDSFNQDKPFDQFTIEQMAGDLLPGAKTEQLVATGFHRNALTNREGGTDPKESRFEQLVNRTNTFSTVWLGLTYGCAQCHDHKYDPISQRNYYELFAFFNQAEGVDIDAPMPGEFGPWMRSRPQYLKDREHLNRVYGAEALQDEWESYIRKAMDNPGRDMEWDFAVANGRPMFDRFEEVIRTPKEQRTPRDRERLFYWFINNPGPVKDHERDRQKVAALREMRQRLQQIDAAAPKLTQAAVIHELDGPVETHIAVKGDYRERGVKVTPAVPAVLPPLPAGAPGNRLTLARWLVGRDNPLTARVAVNRLWQEFFGRGIVRTSEDFGTQGDRPTHPELLDWLAAEFVEQGWSVKKMVRLIVTSATYRQSSNTRPELAERDPENMLLARQSRVRLPAEALRDSALRASGLLNPAVGGPSVHPPQPAGVAELVYAGSFKWKEDEGPARYRRGLYIHYQRTAPYPMLANFDAPDANVACSRRRRSNTPLQALNLLNDPVFYEAAQAMALRVLDEAEPG
ncbi:MAG: DUF1553 domain-containing protein, partial [Bryobacteraceae bacterium]|nr:DUF1553 domain-containing protein [Bryobacteraceae bacterium]